ncbi:MAG TPA: Ig-like domain-containing protein [Thermoanaerobaculia bacterium]
MRENKSAPWRSGLVLAGAILAPVIADAACNTAPTAVADAARAYDQPILIDVLGNDVDSEGQALTVAVTSESCPGQVSVDLDLVTYTPSPPLLQPCQIHYTVADDEGLSDSAAVTVSVIAEIFVDGFESGNASAWSACDPSC